MRVSARTFTVEQDCHVPDLPGRQERMVSLLPTLVHPAGGGPRSSLVVRAEIGNSFPRFLQSLQQSIHAVLRVDRNSLVGQVNLKLHSSQFVEDPSDRIITAFTGHVYGELVLRHD